MPSHRFLYTITDVPPSPAFPDGFKAARPCLEVSLSSELYRTEPFVALMDTGSDYCVFPVQTLQALSIPDSDLRDSLALGHGGTLTLRFAKVKIRVESLGEWLTWVGFAEGDCIPTLGLRGFWDLFRVDLNYREGFFTVEHNESRTSSCEG